MIYIIVNESEIESANAWCKENIDHEGGEFTFSLNKTDSAGNNYALISLPDNDSPYNKAIIAQFGKHDKDPREESVEVAQDPIMIKGKLKEVSTMVQLDDIDEVAPVEKVEDKPIRQWN